MDTLIKELNTAINLDDKNKIIRLIIEIIAHIKINVPNEAFWLEQINQKGNILQIAAHYCSQETIIELLQYDIDNNPIIPIQALQQNSYQNENFLSLAIKGNKIRVIVKVIEMYGDEVFFKKFDTDVTNTQSSNTFSRYFLCRLTLLAYEYGCVPFIKYLLAKGYIEAFQNIIASHRGLYNSVLSYQEPDKRASIVKLLVHYLPLECLPNEYRKYKWAEKLEID